VADAAAANKEKEPSMAGEPKQGTGKGVGALIERARDEVKELA